MKKAVKTLFVVALSLKLSVAAAAGLAYNPELLISRYASWGIDPDKHLASINLKESWNNFKKNKDIVVAVVDTGIQGDHAFLINNIYVPHGKVSSTNFGVDFSGEKVTNAPTDAHGHGTHVAGIVKSIFPEVKILALKYYNPKASGQANLDATIKALKYAVDNNVDVINYSGGGPEASVEELRVLKEAEKKGILVIAAAGNERSNIDDKRHAYYPASYGLSNIITVGAHDDGLNIIPSSNYGKNSVDIAAPGHRIRSAIPNNGAGYMTGTSQATAFVTGVAAMIKSKHPSLKYDQIKNIILSSSLKVKNFDGKILGAGKLDAGRAIELADQVNNKLGTPAARAVANR
ncbi:S8 family serine peptidase [Peredibacter starrii]|uniref:S8 family serine peptidase n=1 Tax=Peredibacter starrii TaxID=28202 RepID=A0AAX4HMY7_9BACT|nr:S8 family serine peptidase [Peredibacter starrii]WPU64611.1 S8 family serine peptidase [Peredibacter starrii]